MDELQVNANGVDFTCFTDGPEDGPLALCLHGFPDTAHTWRHLLPSLASAGFRAVAPFMRGYAPTSVPADGLYQTGALATDTCALHEALGGDERAVLVGHDWGASAVYGAASLEPTRWSRVVAMAVPPSPALGAGFLQYDQIKRSFYMFFFQLPLADFVVPMNDMAFIDGLWRDWSPGYDFAEDMAHVRKSLGDTANFQAALGYYRATFQQPLQSDALAGAQDAVGKVPSQPLLYLHGADDGCIGVDVARLWPDAVIVEGAGHFLHLEKPAEVNGRITEFLTSTSA